MTDQELLEEALNRRLTEVAMRYQNRGDIALMSKRLNMGGAE